MRYRESIKRGMSLLLALVLTVSLIVPAAAADGGSGAELIAAFDKASYSAGETVTVTFTVYGADFDAAGFHVTYDQSSLKYQSVQAGSGFAMPVRKTQAGALELMVESDAVQQPGSDGTVIAAVTFTAVTGGAKTLAFTTGSAAYLERKSAVVYNGYQALSVKARVVEDLEAYNALAAAKASAVQELEAYVEEAMTNTTVAGQTMLRKIQQDGINNINNVSTEKKVRSALNNAKKNVDKVVGYGEINYPKMLELYDGDVKEGTDPYVNMYPAFDPETTVYFFYHGRPPRWAPKTITCVVDENVDVSVDGNSQLNRPRNETKFTVTLNYELKNNVHWIKLTDRVTELSTTYTFYTFNSGVRAMFSDINVYKVQEQEQTALDNMEQSDQLCRAYTDTPDVKIGFKAGISANTEFNAELIDENGAVLQTFSAAGDDEASREFLSDTLHLKSGTNWVMLRTKGQNTNMGEDYAVRVIVIRYISPEDYENNPSLKDSTLEAVSLYYAVGKSDQDGTGTTEKPIDFTFDPETRKYSVTLSADDFDPEKSPQEIRMRITPRSGQQVKVFGGNGTAQTRWLLSAGYYHLADYYSNKMMARDQFNVTITVTAADGIHRDTYNITVIKPGKPGIVVPKVYQVREAVIAATKPIRNWGLVFDSVGITDKNGDLINTSQAAKAGHLFIEIADPTVISWDGKSISGGTFNVALLKQGKTEVTLIYDDRAGSRYEAKTLFYVNYALDMIKVVLKDAEQIISDEKLGVREYEPGATDELRKAIGNSKSVYFKYAGLRRDQMTQENFDEINAAVNDLKDAIMECRWRERGIKIAAFDPLPEDEIPKEVEYNMPPELIGPQTLGATTTDGEHITIYGVTWTYTPEFITPMYESKAHIFTAQLPSGYALARGVMPPTFQVIRLPTTNYIYLIKKAVLFPEAAKPTNKLKTEARLEVYPGTTLEEIFNIENRDGVKGMPGLGLQTQAWMWFLTSLPTEWLEVPNNFSSNIVGEKFTFKFTLQDGGSSKGINFRWNEEVPEEQKIYTMTVEIVKAPTVTVKGLEDTGIKEVNVTGEKTDKVFGETKTSKLTPFTIKKSDGWTYKLTDRGEKLMPLQYKFVPEPIDGYDVEITEPNDKGGNGKDYVIKYVQTDPDEIHLKPSTLTLNIGAEEKVSLVEILPKDTKYTWASDNDSVAKVAPVDLGKGGKITAVEAGTATITLTVTLNGKTLSADCVVTVLSGSGGDGSGDKPGGGDGSGDKPGGGDGNGTGGGGSNSGSTGVLNGQPTASGDYQDLLEAPPQQNTSNANNSSTNTASTNTGTNTNTNTNTNTSTKSQGTRTPETGTPQADTDTAGGGGDADTSTGGTVSRVVSVAKKDDDSDSTPISKKDAAIILGMCGVLLAAGALRGKKRGED